MLLESLITLSCSGLYGNQNDACNKALQSAGQQSGFQKTLGDYEFKETTYFEHIAFDTFGKENSEYAGGTVWVANSIITRKATIGLPNFGICSSIKTELGPNQSMLKFEWKF